MSVVALVASDYLESLVLKEFAEKLAPAHPSRLLAGCGASKFPYSWCDITEAITASNEVVISVSERSEPELYAGTCAIKQGKPLTLVALSYGGWKRPDYLKLREHVSRLFVLDELQKAAAQKLYPQADIRAVGHPAWESFFFPRFSRDEVRAQLTQKRRISTGLNLRPEHTLILVSGEKEVALNMTLAVCVIEAVAQQHKPQSIRVIFAVHPGHEVLPHDLDVQTFYQHELERYEPHVRVVVSCRANPFGIGTPDIVPGADIVIGTNSTIQIQAACLRIPSIGILLRRAFRGQLLPKKREGWWMPADHGAIWPVYGPNADELGRAIRELMRSNVLAPKQEAAFPRAQRIGAAYEQMLAALSNSPNQ